MTQLQAASVVARVAELLEVRSESLSAQLSAPLEDIFDHPCEITTDSTSEYRLNEKTNRLLVRIPASVQMKSSTAEEHADEVELPGRELLRIDLTMALTYELSVAPPPEAERDSFFGAFASLNGTYNAWPYLRELVQDLAARLGVPGLLLPVYRVPRSEEELTEAPPSPRLRVVSGGC